MATYKVPQDVEADDKLLGPFTFRQFVYLLIVAALLGIAWGLSRLFIGLAIIPLPPILLFGALALPLRKDQPMEIYMAAMVSFFLKPRLRLWDPEGVETLIEIIAPKTVEVTRTKDLSQNEAEQRLSYLANIVDSQGWAIRGVGANAMAGASMNNDVYLEAQGATDILDTSTSVAQSFDLMMQQSTERMREEAKQRMIQASLPDPTPAPVVSAPTNVPTPTMPVQTAPMGGVSASNAVLAPAVPVATASTDDAFLQQMASQLQAQQVAMPQNVQFNPYPTFHQTVIQPLDDAAHQAHSDIDPVPAPVQATAQALVQAQAADPAAASAVTPAPKPIAATPNATGSATLDGSDDTNTSDTELSAGIMNLVNNPDFSIETIAREANRLKKKASHKQASDEVVISLR